MLESFFNEVAQACNFIKREIPTHVFSCEYGEVFKNCFFHRTPTLESLSH